MRAPVFGERIEQVDFLTLAGAPAAGQVEVLLLDVQDHHRLLVIEQVGNDDAHALARARGRGEDHELLPAQAHQACR